MASFGVFYTLSRGNNISEYESKISFISGALAGVISDKWCDILHDLGFMSYWDTYSILGTDLIFLTPILIATNIKIKDILLRRNLWDETKYHSLVMIRSSLIFTVLT